MATDGNLAGQGDDGLSVWADSDAPQVRPGAVIRRGRAAREAAAVILGAAAEDAADVAALDRAAEGQRGSRVPRATLDTRPLFTWLRHTAYAGHQEFAGVDALAEHLTGLALDWMEEHGRSTDGSRPAEWTHRDRRKATQTAESVARWTWERMRNADETGAQ